MPNESAPPTPTRLGASDVAALEGLLWGPRADPDDVARWREERLALAPSADSSDGAFALGLVQRHGGPCGVLAAVQAELWRLWLFVDDTARRDGADDMRGRRSSRRRLTDARGLSPAEQERLLARAIVSLLRRALGAPGDPTAVLRVVYRDPDGDDGGFVEAPWSLTWGVDDAAEAALHDLVAQRLVRPTSAAAQAVVCLVFSLLRTRGVATVRADMDDPTATLTASHGHCTQELVNLLLTGVAVSNVFDDHVTLDDHAPTSSPSTTGADGALALRGLVATPPIGYLTQLEVLRYCTVGNRYKHPEVPLWVIGSTSHFSVLCGGGPISGPGTNDRRPPASSLCQLSASQRILARVQRAFRARDPHDRGFLDTADVGPSLIELGVLGSGDPASLNEWVSRLELPGAGIVLWDDFWRVVSAALAPPPSSSCPRTTTEFANQQSTQATTTDEEFARALQAQFDAEANDGGVHGGHTAASSAIVPPPASHTTFELFYYNGLARFAAGAPRLVRFEMTIPAPADFIGTSVPAIRSATVSADGPLEEVLRTKWPEATFHWVDQGIPSID